MGRVEEGVRELIVERYGSIPKFADAIGLPPALAMELLACAYLPTNPPSMQKDA